MKSTVIYVYLNWSFLLLLLLLLLPFLSPSLFLLLGCRAMLMIFTFSRRRSFFRVRCSHNNFFSQSIFILLQLAKNKHRGNMIVWLISCLREVQICNVSKRNTNAWKTKINRRLIILYRSDNNDNTWQNRRSVSFFFVSCCVSASFSPSARSGERRGSISLAAGDASTSHAPTRTRRMSTTKIVDTRPKHLMLGDFELANVV